MFYWFRRITQYSAAIGLKREHYRVLIITGGIFRADQRLNCEGNQEARESELYPWLVSAWLAVTMTDSFLVFSLFWLYPCLSSVYLDILYSSHILYSILYTLVLCTHYYCLLSILPYLSSCTMTSSSSQAYLNIGQSISLSINLISPSWLDKTERSPSRTCRPPHALVYIASPIRNLHFCPANPSLLCYSFFSFFFASFLSFS